MHHDHQVIVDGVSVNLDFSQGIAALEAAIDDLRLTVLQPPPPMDPVQWIESVDPVNIRLPKSKTERPGPVKLNGYQKEFVRFYFDDDTKELYATKGARVGISTVFSFMLCYCIVYLGESVAISQPTDGDALAYYRDRIEPLFEQCPALGSLRRQPRRGDSQDSWNEIHFKNGAVLRIFGATSDDNFRRFGSPHNWMDEYSGGGYAPKKGSQGDKADLFLERGGEYRNPKLAGISTPLDKDTCRTTAKYQSSDACEPWTVCPHCHVEQMMDWGGKEGPGFKWKKDAHGFVESCWYKCVNGCEVHESTAVYSAKHGMSEKEFLDQNTTYRPTKMWEVPNRRGLYIPQWLSFAGQASWKLLAQRFLSAQGNPELLKGWTNNVRGRAYDDMTTAALDGIAMSQSICAYPAEVPDDVVVLTAGVDTQTNKEGSIHEEIASREVSVVGWTRQGQLREIGHWVIPGAPGEAPPDKALTALLERTFKNRHGREFSIAAKAIDLGGHFADETRAYTARFSARNAMWAIKGRNNTKGTRSATVWPKRASRSNKLGANYYVVDSQLAKDAVFRLLQLRDDNAPKFPMSMPADYIEKLLCEERKKMNGGWYWQPKKGRRAEEQWMCLVYAYAALKGLQHTWRKTWGDLNDAGDLLGIPTMSFDPVTGELGYDGPDLSVHAVEKSTARAQLDLATAPDETLGSRKKKAAKLTETKQPESAMVPSETVGEQRKKRKPTWSSGPSRFRR